MIESKEKEYAFFSMMDRMKYIHRWGLMRNNRLENIKEHSMDVAIIAHALALIYNKIVQGIILVEATTEVDLSEKDSPIALVPDQATRTKELLDPLQVMCLGIFHDATEIITGDLPTPIKYQNPLITKAYKEVEQQAVNQLLDLLPMELREDYRFLLEPEMEGSLQRKALTLVKVADRICAYLKCLEEEKSGNQEFISAKETIWCSIKEYKLAEVEYFMEHFVLSYGLTLDQISKSR